MLGDVTGDGKINGLDVTWVMQYNVGSRALDEKAMKAADVNNDGKVNALDVTWIMQHNVGLRTF